MQITTKNWKNLDDRTWQFGNATLLQAPNRSGKTALLQAVQALVLGGTVPKYGRSTPAECMKASAMLGDGTNMELAMDDPAIRIRWQYRNGFKKTLDYNGRQNRKAEAFLAMEFGDDPMVLDLDELLSASPKQRRELLAKLADNRELQEQAWKGRGMDFRGDPNQVVRDAKETLNDLRARQREHEATMTRLRKDTAVVDVDPEQESSLRKQLAELQKKIDETQNLRVSGERLAAQKERAANDLKRLEADLAEAKKGQNRYDKLSAEYQKTQKEITDLHETIRELRSKQEHAKEEHADIVAKSRVFETCPVMDKLCPSPGAVQDFLGKPTSKKEVTKAKNLLDRITEKLTIAEGAQKKIGADAYDLNKAMQLIEALGSVDGIEKEIAKVKAVLEESSPDTEALDVQLQGLRAQMDKASDELNKAMEAKGLQSSIETYRKGVEEIGGEVESQKAVLSQYEAVAADYAKLVAQGVLGDASTIVSAILGDDETLEVDGDGFSTTNRTLSQLSGGEVAAVGAAVLMASLMAMEVKTPILCVESDRLDRKNLEIFMCALGPLAEKHALRVVATTFLDNIEAVDGWTVIGPGEFNAENTE